MKGNIAFITIHHQVFSMIDGENMIPTVSSIPDKVVRVVANDHQELEKIILALQEKVEEHVKCLV